MGGELKEKSLLFCSNEIHPLQSNIYKVRVKDGKRTLLDNGEGVHYGSVNADGTYVEDRYSSPTVARSISLTDTRNGKGRNLLTAKDPWKDYNVPEITCGSIKAADGTTDLYYRMVKPVDFDPNKKYPTLLFCEGGPQSPRRAGIIWHAVGKSIWHRKVTCCSSSTTEVRNIGGWLSRTLPSGIWA